MYQSEFSRETGPVRVCVEKRDLFYFKELAYMTGDWQVPNLQARLAGQRPREELTLQFKSEGHLLAEFSPFL